MDIFFRSGLPRSGSTLLTSILSQNDYFFCEKSDAVYNAISVAWRSFAGNAISSTYELETLEPRRDALAGILYGYYKKCNKPAVISNSHLWICFSIPLLESILSSKLKMIITVRTPYEIISSFEKLRISSPLECRLDELHNIGSSIKTRADFFSSPNGMLGTTFTHLYDALIQGYGDRLLLIDYNKLCKDPGYQMKRIYDFLELPFYNHSFDKIDQLDVGHHEQHVGARYDKQHFLRSSVDENVYDFEKYIGPDLMKSYNTNFWEDLT